VVEMQATDFDLAGFVRVRVIGGQSDTDAVARQLGLPRSTASGDPDVTVVFDPTMEPSGPLRFLGYEDAAYDDEDFFVLRAKSKARALVRIPFGDVGRNVTVTCHPGLPAVPLLIPLLAVTALNRGLVPLHAGALSWNGSGIVVTGWSKGGKTETLLAATEAGARYVGDEWCYIDPGAGRVVGIPEPVTLWAWHLRRFPPVRGVVPLGDRARMALLDGPDRLERRLPGVVQRSSVGRMFRRVAYQLRLRANAWVSPTTLFGVTDAASVPFEHVVLVTSVSVDDVTIQPTAASDIAARMAHSVRYELEPLMRAYEMYRFAFPDRRSEALDRLDRDLDVAIHEGLDQRVGWTLQHPYELDLRRLADALREVLSHDPVQDLKL